ncbi:MAG: hypothetical protein ACPGQD_07135, partial [Planctomycetota bacterium]
MKNKDKDIVPLGDDFEVVTPGPSAAPAARPAASGPLRGAVVKSGVGLLVALAGLFMPYGAPSYVAIQAVAVAVVAWQLLALSMARVHAANKAPMPIGAVLAILAGALGLAQAGETGGVGMVGGMVAVLGGLLSISGPAMAAKADSKLPPAGAEVSIDAQFSKSLLAYLLILACLTPAWSNGGNSALTTYLGALTFLFCLLGAWASWVGMWKMWSMPAVSSGILGLVLFLAPVEAIMLGIFGLVRVVTGDGAMDLLANAWPGEGSQDFLQYGLPPLIVLLAGGLATFELIQGAKKGIAANKQKKKAEIEARKAARAARRQQDVAVDEDPAGVELGEAGGERA